LINTTLTKLLRIESELSEKISSINSDSLAAFPDQNFVDLDQESVEAQQTKLFITNIIDAKKVELGVSVLDRQIEYYEFRFNQLDSYYGFGQPDGLYETMQSILKYIAETRTERIGKMHTTFDIELPKNVNFCLHRYNLI